MPSSRGGRSEAQQNIEMTMVTSLATPTGMAVPLAHDSGRDHGRGRWHGYEVTPMAVPKAMATAMAMVLFCLV